MAAVTIQTEARLATVAKVLLIRTRQVRLEVSVLFILGFLLSLGPETTSGVSSWSEDALPPGFPL